MYLIASGILIVLMLKGTAILAFYGDVRIALMAVPMVILEIYSFAVVYALKAKFNMKLPAENVAASNARPTNEFVQHI